MQIYLYKKYFLLYTVAGIVIHAFSEDCSVEYNVVSSDCHMFSKENDPYFLYSAFIFPLYSIWHSLYRE